MQLDGEISNPCIRDGEEEEIDETQLDSAVAEISSSPSKSPPLSPTPSVVVGCALTSKKKNSFLQPQLIGLSRCKGIHYVSIDLNRPLLEQGPFDIILQKLSGKEWSQTIKDYQRVHPEVIILDPPQAVQHVHNRQSMLEEVAEVKLPDCYGKVCIPKQLIVMKNPSAIPDEVSKAGLRLPLVVKPLFVDGSAKSHELFLAYDQLSPSELDPPMVLQEFINHGGVLFKVYVIGESVKVVRRFSLPDVTKCDLPKISGVFPFPRVSCAAATADEADLDPAVAGEFECPRSSNIYPVVNRTLLVLKEMLRQVVFVVGAHSPTKKVAMYWFIGTVQASYSLYRRLKTSMFGLLYFIVVFLLLYMTPFIKSVGLT